MIHFHFTLCVLVLVLGDLIGPILSSAVPSPSGHPTLAIPSSSLVEHANSKLFSYGQHFPQGSSAVNYVYSGAEGTWKKLNKLNYVWNYYEQWSTGGHPVDKGALIQAANGMVMYTARDANGYLLCDYNRDSEIDDDFLSSSSPCVQNGGGGAFHEHNGRGVGGARRGNAFTQFWLDDNWLAQYMSLAYERPVPVGLVDQPGKFMRWKPIAGVTDSWQLYNSNYFDTLALDGLYYLALGQVGNALTNWQTSLSKSAPVYDSANQQFNYTQIHENYHMALWKILTDMILTQSGSGELSSGDVDLLTQHSMSLRSQILNNQEEMSSTPDPDFPYIGWVSTIGDGNSLINTESVSCGALALGADSKYFFEADRLPMRLGLPETKEKNKYYRRPYHAVSAVLDNSSGEGFLSLGPNIQMRSGSYTATFILRTNRPADSIARLSIFDSQRERILAQRDVKAQDFYGADKWANVRLNFQVSDENNSIELRTYWTNISNLDIAGVKINEN